MPLSADRNAVLILFLLGLAGAALWVGVLYRGLNGPAIAFFEGLNRIYVKIWFRWSSNGPAPLPEQGGAIIVANHTSPLDPHALQCGTDRLIVFLVAREYYEVRGLKGIFRLLRYIPVNRTGRDIAATKAALRALEHGEVLGIFPEGRINPTGEGLLDPQQGVAMIALRRRVPVIPAFIEGTPRGTTMVRSFFQRSKIRVTYGRPIDLSKFYGRERDREVLAEVSGLFMSALAQLGGVEDRWSKDEEKPTRVASD